MARPTCRTCPFWHAMDPQQCRFNPPRVLLIPVTVPGATGMAVNGFFPNCGPDSWCGKHPDYPAYIATLRVDVL